MFCLEVQAEAKETFDNLKKSFDNGPQSQTQKTSKLTPNDD